MKREIFQKHWTKAVFVKNKVVFWRKTILCSTNCESNCKKQQKTSVQKADNSRFISWKPIKNMIRLQNFSKKNLVHYHGQ